MQLYIGNKNYSSWSMRPWVLLRQAGIVFEERMVRFDSFAPDSSFKRTLSGVSPTGRVPLLVDEGFAVWDSLAIVEYLAERFPDRGIWPAAMRDRARARSVCAEMHSGFAALRAACPMNIEASLPEAGALVWRDKPAVRADVARIDALWQELLQASGGPMLFGGFTAADAFFAPVCMRLRTYGLQVSEASAAYVRRLADQPGVAAWIADALVEADFREFEEPYRLQR
jgi:glutathione S-transferase